MFDTGRGPRGRSLVVWLDGGARAPARAQVKSERVNSRWAGLVVIIIYSVTSGE